MTFGQTVVRDMFEEEHEASPERIVDFEEYQKVINMNKDHRHLFGKESKPRALEPDMFSLMTGGYDQNVEADFAKSRGLLEEGDVDAVDKKKSALENENNVKHKINKSKSKFMTETRDAYRRFVQGQERDLLVDYRDDGVENKGAPQEASENHYMSTYLMNYGKTQSQSLSPEREGEDDLEVEDFEEDEIIPEPENNQDDERRKRDKKRRGKSVKKTPLIPKKASMPKQLKKRIDVINEKNSTTRFLPDSAFTTFFDKPAFHSYGHGNVHPTNGGVIYGEYLLSHSINPALGKGKAPQYQQTYTAAGQKSFKVKENYGEESHQRNDEESEIKTQTRRRNLHKEREVSPEQEKPTFKRATKAKKAKPAQFTKAKKAVATKVRSPAPEKIASETDSVVSERVTKPKRKVRTVAPKKEPTPIVDVPVENKATRKNPITGEELSVEEAEPSSIFEGEQEEQDPQFHQPSKQEVINLQAHIKEMLDKGAFPVLQEINGIPFYCFHDQTSEEPLHELDPKNYKFVPAHMVDRIRPAGRNTYKSEALYNVILGEQDEE